MSDDDGTLAIYSATEQHIRLIQAKRVTLDQALLDAEAQYIVSVARAFEAGQVTWSELVRAYRVVKDGGIPGYGTRWQSVIPYTPQHMNRMAALTGIEEWSGQGMNVHLDPGRPPKGAFVVYILFDEVNHPVYVGSTGSFASRMSHHRRDKVWASWVAHRCEDRAHAYEVEDRFLRQYLPGVNRQGARSAS